MCVCEDVWVAFVSIKKTYADAFENVTGVIFMLLECVDKILLPSYFKTIRHFFLPKQYIFLYC